MRSFLKNFGTSNSNKQTLIKKNIMTQLSDTIKEIQLSSTEESLGDITEAENSLCTIIEAIFLHGLKDTVSYRIRKAISEVDSKPEPSFWSPLLIISHKQTINRITSLNQINTEIGQCRAWIRIVLNDCLLSSYLNFFQQDSAALKPYYVPQAYLRDQDVLDVTHRLVEGLESGSTFALPCNSSLLNSWSAQSLLLAGLWTPTLRSCPVASGVDIAECLQASGSANSETCSIVSFASTSNSFIGPNLSEDEALKIILGKKEVEEQHEKVDETMDEIKIEEKSEQETELGNSLKEKSCWSIENKEESTEPVMEKSFNSLIESYSNRGANFVTEVWQSYEEQLNTQDQVHSDCEIVNSIQMADCVGKIALEIGLDEQNFECNGCKKTLNVYQKPNVCRFTGGYFCNDCMSSASHVIPAYITYNWDFREYPVSKAALDYITEIKDDPVIDFKESNPQIYEVVQEMATLCNLRKQLNYLRAYLYTCQNPVIEQLHAKLGSREYLYQDLHKYSISDLTQLADGLLAAQLSEVILFATEHVYNCFLCKGKAFFCEVCNKPKPIYPFDMDNTYRCDECGAVYHKGCMDATKPCPKCERRRKREDLPLLDAVINV